MFQISRTTGVRRLAVLLPLVLGVCSGCGGADQPPTGTVHGTVTLAKQPLAAGVVTLHFADGSTTFAMLRADGGFTIENAKVGAARVAVAPRVPLGLTKGPSPKGGKGGKAAPRIPQRYHAPNSSGLICEVFEGEQTLTIALDP